MSHIGVIGQAIDGSGYSWFCREIIKGNCTGEGYGYDTHQEAEAAIVAFGHEVEDESRRPGRFDGIPGLVWYATVRKVRGADLKAGDWLDSLDHRGARMIYDVRVAVPGSGFREVAFSNGGFTVYDDGSSDSETVRDDVEYDVVDPDSQVAPDGSPL